MVKLLLCLQRTSFCFSDDGERAAQLVRPETSLCPVRLMRLLRASQVPVGILPCVVYAHTGAEGELKRAYISDWKTCRKTVVH